MLDFHRIYNLSPPSAVQHSPSVRQNNTAVLLPNDTVTHDAGYLRYRRKNLFMEVRLGGKDL